MFRGRVKAYGGGRTLRLYIPTPLSGYINRWAVRFNRRKFIFDILIHEFGVFKPNSQGHEVLTRTAL